MWAVYNGEVRGEVGKRSGMCCVGLAVWVHGAICYYCIFSNLIRTLFTVSEG